MKIEYIDHMGSDLTVVNAARVSLAKESEWDKEGELPKEDEKLISYLAKHNHISPFFHPTVQYRVSAPIFVARQWFRSNVGIARNETSRRYVDDVPTFYIPDYFRPKAEHIKQGSADEPHKFNPYWQEKYELHLQTVSRLYQSMIEDGVAPEQARMVLPQSMYTEWIETASLAACVRIYKLRIDSHAQKEIQELAQMLKEIVAPLFPVSWDALVGV